MSRRARAPLASLLSVALLLGTNFWRASADSAAPPDAPTSLSAVVPGLVKSIPAGAWVSSTQLQFRFQAHVPAGTALTPQVEVAPAESAFNGRPAFQGAKLSATGLARVMARNLTNGQAYRWQARVVDDAGNASPWAIFNTNSTGAADFAVDVTAPTRPVIASTSDPNETNWYNSRTVNFRWGATDALSGIKGYTFVLEQRPSVIPPGPLTTETHISLKNLSDGVWILAVRAADRAGNWSPTATFRVQLDRQAPHFSWLSPRRFAFNPFSGPTTVRFSVSKVSNVKLQLFRVGSAKPVRSYRFDHITAGSAISIVWNGKDDRNKTVPKGFYFFSVQALDHANNAIRTNAGGIDVNPQRPSKAATGQPLYPGDGKRIIVSLSRQTLYAYDGTHLFLQTVVTTGNPNLPTPPGTYAILAKYHPYEFVSPWPMGSPYYYTPSLSNYAMLFRDGGYFLHDAPWRSAFGPGTNGAGQPGTNYGGTHGCVNIPPGPTLALWNWAPVGTTVLVVN